MRLDISPAAEQDLDDVWSYIAEDSLSAADRVLDRLKQSMQRLLDQPLMGANREELGEDLRMVVSGSYLVFYRPTEAVIQVLRILHGHRDLHADLF